MENKVMEPTWQKMAFVPNESIILPKKYVTFTLNKEQFNAELLSGFTTLPNPDGSISKYKVSNSSTMSEELQAKFPNIKSYKGTQEENPLCSCRIDQKDTEFKIMVLCNDATFYTNNLLKNGVFFTYYKSDLPEGVGTVNE